ncbi:MAG: cell division protein ZapE [Cardiobacteriaceae bacterium]|nr:cell division protein ZapE [Cardiobacteriaceae bacterium]
MTLLDHYRAALAAKDYSEDPAQLAVLAHMQRIADELAAKKTAPAPEKKGFLSKWLGKADSAPTPWIKGLYCFGGVGRGKTFLMDLFMAYLPSERKRRRHFHRFMLELHEALNAAGNIENPVEHVVKNMSEDIDILCLDEFFVSDITDAMLLARLFDAMEKHGITLVTTSNVIPQDLYKNGLQRERFLPAIAWIEENLVVHAIDAGEDYRRRHFSQDNVFRLDNPDARQALAQDLAELTGENADPAASHYRIGSRDIPLVARSAHSITFAFDPLCTGHYSQKDYIDIGKRFAYVGLVGVPVLDEYQEDAARRFLLLIDEFYDRGVKLLITSAVPLADIYQGKKLAFEYARLQSRLFEMQGESYWQSAHRP